MARIVFGIIGLCKNKLVSIYKKHNYDEEAELLIKSLSEISEQDIIRIVFIGQYTAGKSTVISALTTDDTIKIDSNISTDRATDYPWSDVILTDTPGLYTENPEHDQKTIEAIKRSDLLVYCITSDLFNQYTKEDFEKWAFCAGYAGKMFLIVNKMSKEAGEYEDLVENYREAINRSLDPHSICEFYYSFIDAKDYKDGVKDRDRELIELSHFECFIEQLNSFIANKGLLGHLDAPVKILKNSMDEMEQKVLDNDKDRAFSSLLSRIENRIDQQRKQFDIDSRKIIKGGLRVIKDKGYELSRDIGVNDISFTEDDLNDLITNTCESMNAQLIELCNENEKSLNNEVKQVLDSQQAVFFFNSIAPEYSDKRGLFQRKEARVARLFIICTNCTAYNTWPRNCVCSFRIN